MCIINSYMNYQTLEERKSKKPITHYRFVKSLINQLRGDFHESRTRPSTSWSNNRLNNKQHICYVTGRKRDCIACSYRKTPSGRRRIASKLIMLRKIMRNKILIY